MIAKLTAAMMLMMMEKIKARNKLDKIVIGVMNKKQQQ